ncbi:MAG: thiol reductant ABC exporter subunit CydC [Firmicutes bacterium]|nr:thiol reductant ABC exporter subunit CydC [Bacillota bacterium]
MKTFVRLWKLMAPHWKKMLGAAMLGFLTVASNMGLMGASALLIARAALRPPVLDLLTLIVGVRFLGISRAVFRYLERYVSHDVAFRVLSQLRVKFYRAIEPLAPARLADYRSGDLLSRIVADVETLENFYVRVLAPTLVALMILAVVFVFLAWFDLKLAFAVLGSFLAAGVGAPLVVRFLSRKTGRRVVEVRATLHANLVDSIQGMGEIAAFGQTRRRQEQVGALDRELMSLQGRMAGIAGLSGALTSLAMNLAMWSVLVLAIPLVSRGTLDWTYLAMLALTALSSFEAVTPLPLAFQYLEESFAAAQRLFEITDAQPAVQDLPGALSGPLPVHLSKSLSEPLSEPRGYNLQVDGLSFRYAQGEPWALRGLDLALPEGGRVAIVGPSGAGKSTLVNLLLRFWDYEHGSIRLGGHELKKYRQEDLRRLFGVVAQHTHLFNATVRENLLLARPESGEDEMIQAARDARIHDFIQSLPQGYDTYVGEGGFKLSGGQRQRLAIARALLKNSPILVLDEPTAGLDPVTEQEVMKAIHRLMEGRTTLVITHRLAGLEIMDGILVLKAGRVMERGRQETLLEQRGLYRKMWDLQHQIFPDDVYRPEGG